MEIVMKGYNLDSFRDKDIYTWDEIISVIEDLECDVERLQDELEHLKEDVRDNYKYIEEADQLDMSEIHFAEY